MRVIIASPAWTTFIVTHESRRSIRALLPEVPGIYVIFRQGLLLYIGQSRCVAQRLSGVHSVRPRSGDVVKVRAVDDRGRRNRLEAWLIKRLSPPANRALGRPTNAADPLVQCTTALPADALKSVRVICDRDRLAESAVLRMLVLEALRARGEV